VARAVDPSDGTDPTDDAVDVVTADDPEFADGFEVFNPDDEQAELAGEDDDDDVSVEVDDDIVLAVDGDDDDLVVDVVVSLDNTQFDADDTVVDSNIDDDTAIDEEVEGVRGTEFVCLGCYLAKRRTQLADKKRSLCIDCV
jgi:hypothetical protein